MATAVSFAAVHAAWRKISPCASRQSAVSFAIAAVPSGTSVAAGPFTVMFTDVMRVGSPGTTSSVTTAGRDARSMVTVIAAEK